MSNIITAVFTPGNAYTRLSGAWQYDYGQVLRIQGLQLPPAVEVHFSLTETGGEAVTRIGVTQDGVTDVPVPDSLLENANASHDYTIYAFLYLANGSAGNTEYKISLQVRSRPRPEVPGSPEEPELFREAVEAVNKAADRAETAAGEAAGSAVAADESATKAGEAADAAINTETRIKNLEQEIKKVGQDAEDAVRQQETASKQAVTDHTDVEIGRMQQAVKEADDGIKESLKDAGTAKVQLDGSVEDAGTAKTALDKSIEDASTGKAALDASVTKAGTAKTALDKSIADATAGKTALDKTNQTATSLKTELEKDITAGSQLKTDLKTAGDTAMKAIQDEAATQLDKVQHASDDIIADLEQIAQNKDDIEALSKTVNANIPDDDVVGDKPWTSKHIVDMLCPPIEETGNPVQCYPVPGYPLGITASWEPTQEGSGDPSPDNIRPIKGRDRVTVTRCGQNLVQPIFYNAPYDVEVGGLIDVHRMEKVSDDAITVSEYTYTNSGGSWSSPMSMIVAISGGSKYTISGNVSGDGYRAGWYVLDKDGVVTQRSENWTTVPPIQITTSSTDAYLIWYINSIGESVSIDRPMIVLGDVVPTEYVPYTGNTVTLSLPETIYGGTVDATSGEGRNEWKIITIDANEIKFSIRGNSAYWNLPNGIAAGIAKGSKIVCSHFISTTFSINEPYEFLFTQPTNLHGLFSNVDELNDYCAAQYAAGTPVRIAYNLANPVSFEADGAVALPGLQGINTVLTDADSVAVTGREDLLHVLSGIQSSE